MRLLNLAGAVVGTALYGLLLAMVVGARRAASGRAERDPLPLMTAVLGIAWNVCAVLSSEGARAGFTPEPWIACAGFTALGFLPAVVVHSVGRDERRRMPTARRVLIAVGYAGSTVAAAMHVWNAATGGPVPSPAALRLLTAVFVGLLVPLAVATRRQPGWRRALWVVALAAFAVSALHLSRFDDPTSGWAIELVGHHASIPLAVAILYQDYPFALADLFLIRALLLVVLIGCAAGALSVVGIVAGAHLDVTPIQVALLLATWVATALAYPFLKRGADWFVDAVVLARPDYATLETGFARDLEDQRAVERVLDLLRDVVRRAVNASDVTWALDVDAPVPARTLAQLAELDGAARATVQIPVSEAPAYRLTVAGLRGGRRLLSGDATMLTTLALLAARRIDAIRLAGERDAQTAREREMTALATEAELRALRAQLNPHFLFNALTTIGYLVTAAPSRAVETLMQLTTILRAVLRSEGEFTTLARELEIVDAYLQIEHARFEDRLRIRIDVPAAIRSLRIPALLIQPLVENAVKHGIGPEVGGGEITVEARVVPVGGGRELRVRVRDRAAPGARRTSPRAGTHGVGLSSIERRLACHYGPAARLSLPASGGAETVVEVAIPLEADRRATAVGA